MKSNMLVLIALLSVAGLVGSARAQEAEVVVSVPFEFVVGATTLPAGTYTVSRTSSLALPLLVANHDHGVYLIPTAFDGTKVGDTSLSFDQIAGEHVLSQIKTLDGAYTIDNTKEAKRLTKLAQSNDHTGTNGMTSAGGN